MKAKKGVKQDIELDADDMKELVELFKAFYKEEKGEDFPDRSQGPAHGGRQGRVPLLGQPPRQRLPPHERYPLLPGAPPSTCSPWYSATLSDNSGTGVAFTRDPATGEKALFGEYLINAQGEDVVAGVRTPSPISKLQEDMPEVYEQFADIANRLEKHYQRHAGHGVHHRERQALHAADPQRQAHRRRRSEDRRATWWTRA